MKAKPLSKAALRVKLANGVLSISIGMGTLATAIRYSPDLSAYDEVSGKTFEPTITNANVFGKELIRALEDEDEEGSTPVHLMLDTAILSAIESGAEGIETGDDKIDKLRQSRRASS